MRDNITEIDLITNFSNMNMTIEERNFIVTFLYKTKGLADNPDMCIVSCNLKKLDNNTYTANGLISAELSQNRCFDTHIKLDKNNIIIESHMTRLGETAVNKEFIEYTEFQKINDNTYTRNTRYSYNNISYEDVINIDNFDIIYEKPKKI